MKLSESDLKKISQWITYSTYHPSWDPAIVLRDFHAAKPLAECTAEVSPAWPAFKFLPRKQKEQGT